VELAYAQDLNLRIRDNGAGIDPDIVHHGKPGHLGLQNMRECAKLVRGKLIVCTAPESGTEIELTVPAAHVYAGSSAPCY
jgi:signal transduction histidine kinase